VLDASIVHSAIGQRRGAATAWPRPALRMAASLLVLISSFVAAAWIGDSPPFSGSPYDPYSETAVLRAIPFDAPLPYDMSVITAGHGRELPYHTQWTATGSLAEIEAQFREHLAGSPRWTINREQRSSKAASITLVRFDSDGYLTHFARLAIESARSQTIVTFDFTPIPTSTAPTPR
jgi:hypothetical protein